MQAEAVVWLCRCEGGIRIEIAAIRLDLYATADRARGHQYQRATVLAADDVPIHCPPDMGAVLLDPV